MYENALEAICGSKEVPNLFVNGERIGGLEETWNAKERGDLINKMDEDGDIRHRPIDYENLGKNACIIGKDDPD